MDPSSVEVPRASSRAGNAAIQFEVHAEVRNPCVRELKGYANEDGGRKERNIPRDFEPCASAIDDKWVHTELHLLCQVKYFCNYDLY